MKHSVRNVCKSITFMVVGVVLFLIVQNLLVQKWNYPVLKTNTSLSFDTFYNLDKNSIQVLYLGTSHVIDGISPIEIYDDCGIVSYNLGFNAQSIDESYYILKSALTYQCPNLVVLDVSSLLHEDYAEEYSWRHTLDNMPLGVAKVEAAVCYARSSEANNFFEQAEYFFSAICPMITHHSLWEETGEISFRDFIMKDYYPFAGYMLVPSLDKSAVAVDEMNRVAEYMYWNGDKKTITFDKGTRIDEECFEPIYKPAIPDYNSAYLEKIKGLCDEKGCDLLLVKVPTSQYPNIYEPSWTNIKSDLVEDYANQNGYAFYNPMYDSDYLVEEGKDFWDNGGHLNYYGATKFSELLGTYIASNYDILPKADKQYDAFLQEYSELSEVAELMSEFDFDSYMKRLSNNISEYIICVAAKSDMATGLSDSDIESLHALGLSTDYKRDMCDLNSYVAIIDGGDTKFEQVSNRKINYSYRMDDENSISITSSGYYSMPDSSILVNNKEYSLGINGINIVVYSKENKCVVDSVWFDTFSEEPHNCLHKDSLDIISEYWLDMERKKL